MNPVKTTEGEMKARIVGISSSGRLENEMVASRPLSCCAVTLGRGRWWQDCSFLALLTASAAGAHPGGAGGTGIRGAHHHVAAAGGAAHSCVDSRGSTRDAEIARDDATAGAAHA